jgi:prepilin-type N-terminal cleavage/methylation domain-containing protein
VKFQAAPETQFRGPRWRALALGVAALAFAVDALFIHQDTRRLLGSGVALVFAAWYWLRSRAEPGRDRCPDCGASFAGAACPRCAEGGGSPFPMGRGRGRLGKTARGFTLIEIMMTVAITAMVFAMIGGILLSVIKASEKIELKLRTEKAGYGALSLIRRDLTGVYAYALGGVAFRGENNDEGGKDADKLRFVTSANVVETEDGVPPRLVEVGYQFSAEDDGLVMFRRAAPLDGDPLAGDGEYVEILNGIESFNLEYLDPKDLDWKEGVWETADSLPLAVKIRLELMLTEAQRIQAEQNEVEIPPPLYEMTVGIPADASPNVGEAATPAPGGSPAPAGS